MPVEKVTETERIAEQLRRMYDGPSWLGPSLQELLGDVDEDRARARSVPSAHGIWELVLHMTAWLRIARERLSAKQLRDATAEENWPGMQGSWQGSVASLDAEVNALERAILDFPEERLDEIAPAAEAQTFYILLQGVVQHCAYHAGQIALLKKA